MDFKVIFKIQSGMNKNISKKKDGTTLVNVFSFKNNKKIDSLTKLNIYKGFVELKNGKYCCLSSFRILNTSKNFQKDDDMIQILEKQTDAITDITLISFLINIFCRKQYILQQENKDEHIFQKEKEEDKLTVTQEQIDYINILLSCRILMHSKPFAEGGFIQEILKDFKYSLNNSSIRFLIDKIKQYPSKIKDNVDYIINEYKRMTKLLWDKSSSICIQFDETSDRKGISRILVFALINSSDQKEQSLRFIGLISHRCGNSAEETIKFLDDLYLKNGISKEKITAYTTDGCNTMISVRNQLQKLGQDKECFIVDLSCFLHQQNLILSRLMFEEVFQPINKLLEMLSNSLKLKRTFSGFMIKHKAPYKSITKWCITRWTSRYGTIKHVFEMRTYIITFLWEQLLDQYIKDEHERDIIRNELFKRNLDFYYDNEETEIEEIRKRTFKNTNIEVCYPEKRIFDKEKYDESKYIINISQQLKDVEEKKEFLNQVSLQEFIDSLFNEEKSDDTIIIELDDNEDNDENEEENMDEVDIDEFDIEEEIKMDEELRSKEIETPEILLSKFIDSVKEDPKYLIAKSFGNVDYIHKLSFTLDILKFFYVMNKANQAICRTFNESKKSIDRMREAFEKWNQIEQIENDTSFEHYNKMFNQIRCKFPLYKPDKHWVKKIVSFLHEEVYERFQDFDSIELLTKLFLWKTDEEAQKLYGVKKVKPRLSKTAEMKKIVKTFKKTFNIRDKNIVKDFGNELLKLEKNSQMKPEEYPIMKKVYNSLQSLFPTTVICENGFSRMNFILNPRRSSMSDDTLEKALFLALWDTISSEPITKTIDRLISEKG